MAHAQALLHGALEELELAKGQEERRLAQAAAALRREYEAHMLALERRFLAEAQALQVGGWAPGFQPRIQKSGCQRQGVQ